MSAAFLSAFANSPCQGFRFLVVRREFQQPVQGLQSGGSLALSALDNGQIHACTQLRGIMVKDGFPKAHRIGVLMLTSFEQSKVSGGQGAVGIGLERHLILLDCCGRLPAHLVEEAELCVQFMIVPGVVRVFRPSQQRHRPLAGSLVATRSHLGVGQSQISIVGNNAADCFEVPRLSPGGAARC